MRSHWRDRSGSAASGASSAPNSGKKERSAWLPPSSGTNSSAGTRKSKVRIIGKGSRNFLAHGDSKVRKRREIRRPKTPEILTACNVRVFDKFLARSLRRRAGSAGVPWPLSEAPRLSFWSLKRNAVPSERSEFESILDSTLCGNDLAYPSHSFPALSFRIFLLRAFELISPAIQRFFSKLLRLLEVSGARTASRVRHSHQRRGPLPLRRLYFRAGDFHRASERG